MNVSLSATGNQLPTDIVIEWTGRSDLVPVPRNLEFTVKLIDGVEKSLKAGVSVWSGRENLEYRIVKTDRAAPMGEVQGKSAQQAMKVTCLLATCASIAMPLASPIIMSDTTFGAVYRACGAYASVGSDFVLPRFSCFKGKEPSFGLAQVLQEEGAALVLSSGVINAMRLVDMAKQTPKDDMGQIDPSAKITSDFLQMQQIPTYYTVDDTAAVLSGPNQQARQVAFRPGMDLRQLRNASSVLVRNKTIESTICQQLQAGDVLTVGTENLIVVTAAHWFKNNEGAQESKSRLWLGSLVNAS